MKTKFVYSPTIVSTFKEQEGQIQDKLLPEIYILKFHPMMGYYLERDKLSYELPSTLYGTINKKSDKIITAFKRRSKSTGVMLTGNKGSGKSELIKVTANKMLSEGYPIIAINEPFQGQDFMTYIESLGECVLIFDEFAKTYNKGAKGDDVGCPQESLLTLFDGLSSSKRLVLISENNEYNINEFMKNRPGRMYYHFKYDKIEIEVVSEYCEAMGISKEFTKEISDARTLASEFSFDVLKALVEEHLAYPSELLEDLAKDMNIELSEPSYEFEVIKIDSPLIEEGLVEISNKKIPDFKRYLDYDSNSQKLVALPTAKLMEKFPNESAAVATIKAIISRTNYLKNKDLLAKELENIAKMPDIKRDEPLFIRPDVGLPLYLYDDTQAGDEDDKVAYESMGFTIIGRINTIKKQTWASSNFFGAF